MNARAPTSSSRGNALVIAILEQLEREEVTVCERALREGVVRRLPRAEHRGSAPARHERMRRIDAAHELAERFGGDAVHENQVAGWRCSSSTA